MSKENVKHRGVVEKVGPGYIIIRTQDECKCDGCAITALCNSKDGGKELLTIDTPSSADFTPGDRVEASASPGSTLQAAWWALILPTIVFAGVTLACRFGCPEMGGWSLAVGFAALALYDLFLYRQRKRLAQKVSWTVTKL
ncbi:MAG: SoxR reducing system RseC family protein [Staphylococcus sp.]|nr:SoxR reducing system RseC family protein [Staphylococcus sp.]